MNDPRKPVDRELSDDRLDRVLARASVRLHSRLEADLLAGHVLARPRSWLFAHGDSPMDEETRAAFEQVVDRRLAGEPMAQILGYRAFYGRDYQVSPEVLIPRPETELLVELALTLDLPEAARCCDVGTGSGCIALTLAAERPDWSVTALDCCPSALAVARRNARIHGTEGIRLELGQLLEPVDGERFDLIVSNPPYIAAGDPHLGRGDLRFEPRLALAAGPEGLDVIRPLIGQARHYLAPGGWLAVEHGHDQAEAVSQLFRQAGFLQVATHRDLAGIERVTLGRAAA